ncbi:hypothetical protein [Microcoleus sp. FACHB-672]|uniref:hypothetical protein n=1 Tax=Microcoleus sp. FACHB-672 TaxID=2692825 RepID=UPI0016854460|nr:hypothetical protein [Microcoleus sp. FACHB-672]MBD2042738.1 hypothetical protein [Microcoleus sp. FACHB-672]
MNFIRTLRFNQAGLVGSAVDTFKLLSTIASSCDPEVQHRSHSIQSLNQPKLGVGELECWCRQRVSHKNSVDVSIRQLLF